MTAAAGVIVDRMDPELTITIDLLQQAQDGNKEALNRLFDRYYERVRRIVRLRLGNRLRQRVESGDILQETFVAAVGDFDRFEVRDEASFINWLSKIAERQVLAAADYFGAKKRNMSKEVPLVTHDTSGRIGIDPVETGLGPGEEADRIEQTRLVEECIQTLPDGYRELIILRNYAGASWDIVAEETGRPSAAAARMMHAKAMVELGKAIRKRSSG
ncbi:MAG: RNA polymerase sigma factor [Planctomycetota bacterium]|jgi:RNA polymerase sigma-70 factor (ECF subfamily)